MTLQQQGHRFTFHAGIYTWTHPALMTAEHVDCTDMDNDLFAVFVENNPPKASGLLQAQLALHANAA